MMYADHSVWPSARQAIPVRESRPPLPPQYPGWKFEPMIWREVERWIDSYNAWVATWNLHERSRDLPLSPDWPDAQLVFVHGRALPLSALAFRARATGRLGVIRLTRWKEFAPGWSFLRNVASIDQVVWAAYEDTQA